MVSLLRNRNFYMMTVKKNPSCHFINKDIKKLNKRDYFNRISKQKINQDSTVLKESKEGNINLKDLLRS